MRVVNLFLMDRYILPSVLAAEAKMTAEGINKEYAGMAGVQEFVDLSLKFAYADAGNALADGRVAGVQAMSMRLT